AVVESVEPSVRIVLAMPHPPAPMTARAGLRSREPQWNRQRASRPFGRRGSMRVAGFGSRSVKIAAASGDDTMSERYKAYHRLQIDYPAERVLRITFNRPETYNSVDAETHTQLTNIWRDIDADPDISAVIVTGAGKAFSAGGDFGLL